MFETGLVYIHSEESLKGFIGCGALVEGPFVVTCRHVWEDALSAAAGKPVLVCFPPHQGDGDPVFSPATLADSCDQGTNPPDLVILEAENPTRNVPLTVACAGVAETGPAILLMGLRGRDTTDPYAVDQNTVGGALSTIIASNRLRQFTGERVGGYWPDHGSSGSPVGLREGTALAGILCKSEISPRTATGPGEAAIHEAFVLPASTIHAFLRAHVGRVAAEARNLEAAKMPGILKMLVASRLSIAELRSSLDEYFARVEAAVAENTASESAEAARPLDDAMVALTSARALSAKFEPTAAMAVLDEALAEEARNNGRSLLLLLVEKAGQQQLFLDDQGAISCLSVITVLDPDLQREWIALGDIQRRSGNLKAALAAYRSGLRAASHARSQFNVATAHQRVGDVLRGMGDLVGALAEARAGLAIIRDAADQNRTSADLQRELTVSLNSIGGILTDLGEFDAALHELGASRAITQALCVLDPGQPRWQHDLSISHERIGRVLLARGDLPAAHEAFQAAADIRKMLAARDLSNAEWQRELGVSLHKVGETSRAQAMADAKAGNISEHTQQNLLNTLETFRAALAIFEPLSSKDPGNADLKRDVSAAYSNIGSILLLQKDIAGALSAYRANLKITEYLAESDPDNANWQRDLLVSCASMANVDPAGKRPWLARALAIATQLAGRGRLAPSDLGMIPDLQARLDALPPDSDPPRRT